MVRRQLGRKLRKLRTDAEITLEGVQIAGLGSVTKMQRVEAGRVSVKPGDVMLWAELYGLDDRQDQDRAVIKALVSLAKGTREDGWWEQFGSSVPEWLGLYAGLEGYAMRLSGYHPELVLGLLQTVDYARAVMQAGDEESDEKVIEARVRFRLGRQDTFFNRATAPGHLQALLGAGALSLVVGSPEIMAAQIAHIRDLSAAGTIEARILPWTVGAHPASNGPFTIMDFSDPDDPDLVHIETYAGTKFFESHDDVERHRQIFTTLYMKAIPIEEYRT